MVERREILKGIGIAAAAAATVSSATDDAKAQALAPTGPMATPWNPADPQIPGRMNV